MDKIFESAFPYIVELLPVVLFGLLGGSVATIRSRNKRTGCFKIIISLSTSVFASIMLWSLISVLDIPIQTKIFFYAMSGFSGDWTINKIEKVYKSRVEKVLKTEKK